MNDKKEYTGLLAEFTSFSETMVGNGSDLFSMKASGGGSGEDHTGGGEVDV